ncbi:MAG TPA: efflux RND transporter periplasmic adaptor subunit [Terriglobales bacterium]|nr:efflux RND transporter periplasmic adaptor subunit [Terriglobales bacterium]
MPLNGNHSERQKRRWWVTALPIVAAVAVLGAIFSKHDDPLQVRVAEVELGKIRSVISTNGKIEPVNNFEAHSPLATSVKRVFVKEGSAVKKGQLLLSLDDAEIRTEAARTLAQLKSAQADLAASQRGGTQEEVLSLEPQLVKAHTDRDTAQRNLEALKRLESQGAASAGEVQEAQNALARANAQLDFLEQKKSKRYSSVELARVEAQRDQAQTAYDAAQDSLAKANVRAPFDGIVYSLPVQQGGFVSAGELLLQVADLRKVQVRSFVDEPDVARLALGDPIEITWDAVPGRVWHAAVTSIPSTVRPRGARNVGETTSIVDNNDFKLLPNVNVGVTIVAAEHDNVLIVPREAIRTDDSKPYVLQVVDHQLKHRDVETSISNLTQVEITRGLAAKDLIATGSVSGKPLGDGMQVKY